MHKAGFRCESCMFESPRRWNINRHIRTAHNGAALAFNFKTGKTSTQPSSAQSPYRHNLIPFPHNQSMDKFENEFAEIELDLKNFVIKEEKAMLSIYEELEKRIIALEDYVSSKQMDDHQIPKFLIYSLLTESPIHTLDEIIRVQRIKRAKKKILSNVSRIFSGDTLLLDSLVSLLIKETQDYKHKSKYQKRS